MFSSQDIPGGGTDQSPDQGPPAEWHVPEDGESRPLSSVGGGTRTESFDQVEIPSVEGYNQLYVHTGLQDRGSHGRSKEQWHPCTTQVTNNIWTCFRCVTSTLFCFFFSVGQMEDGSVQRDFRKILSLTQVTEALLYFTRSQLEILVVTLHFSCFRKHVQNHIMIRKQIHQEPHFPTFSDCAWTDWAALKNLNWIKMSYLFSLSCCPVGELNEITLWCLHYLLLNNSFTHLCSQKAYHSRLLALSDALQNSLFFRSHEVCLHKETNVHLST